MGNIRNSLLVLLLCILPIIGYSQVSKFRAFQYINCSYKDIDITPWIDANMLIVFDLESDKIKIYSKETQNLDIVKQTDKEEDKDITTYYYNTVDKYGQDCKIGLSFYKNSTSEHIATLTIYYNTFVVMYRLKQAT